MKRTKGGWNGARLRAAREDRQLSQAALGGLLEPPAPRQRIAEWEGVAAPSLETVRRLAQALGASPGWLAFGEVAPAPALPSTPATRCRSCSRIVLNGPLLGYVLMLTTPDQITDAELVAALRVHLRHQGQEECAVCENRARPGGELRAQEAERLYRTPAYEAQEQTQRRLEASS
jgi:transcriptional regulator with XRE-family HTH domain